MLSNAANVATIAGTGLAVWAALARVLTRARRRRVSDFLSRGENGSLLREHSADLAAFNHAAQVVEQAGGSIMTLLQRILKDVGGK